MALEIQRYRGSVCTAVPDWSGWDEIYRCRKTAVRRESVFYSDTVCRKGKPPFKLPERYCNCRRIRAYLNHRGISDEVITYCISHEILYESVPYHNAVFVGKDESGKARYAFLRGIYEKTGKDSRWSRPGVKKVQLLYSTWKRNKTSCRIWSVYWCTGPHDTGRRKEG